MLKHIPNLITLGNLLCGCLAIYFSQQTLTISLDGNEWVGINYKLPFIFVLCSLVLDYLDGFAAKLLNAQSAIGKELDSLADVVSFGVAPMFILFTSFYSFGLSWINYSLFLIPLIGAYRLANFNVNENQTEQFIGIPIPAIALFNLGIASLIFKTSAHDFEEIYLSNFLAYDVYFNLDYAVWKSPLITAVFALLFSFLMISNIPMFNLKFSKDISWRTNWYRYLIIGFTIILLPIVQLTTFIFVIPFYLILSIVLEAQQLNEVSEN